MQSRKSESPSTMGIKGTASIYRAAVDQKTYKTSRKDETRSPKDG